MTTVLVLGASLVLVGCEEDDEGLLEPEIGVTAANFAAFDLDNDNLLDENEFAAGFVDAGVFTTFDEDATGFLEADEFDNDLGDFGAFDLDNDARLTEDEFLTGTFGAFDTDADLFVDESEFGIGLDLF